MFLSFYRKEQIQGIILLAPALGINPDFEPCLRRLVKCMNYICPCLPLKKMEPGLMSKNPLPEEDFRQDELFYHGKMNVRTAV